MVAKLIFRQLFEPLSCTYTYLLGCPTSRKAIIIDPVLETFERDAKLIQELDLDPIYGANTHIHADHVTATGELKRIFPHMRSVLSKYSGGKADVQVDDLGILKFGSKILEVRTTPGHTGGCVTYVLHDDRMAFTGDALLIRGCGRTDFQHGSSRTLYRSVHDKILSLPEDFTLYPAHDYKGFLQTSVMEEKKYNPRLTKSMEEFVDIMENLKLPYPQQIDKALSANHVCGVFELMDEEAKIKVFGKTKR